VLEHAVGVEADAALALPLLGEMGPDVHARRGHPCEEGLVCLITPRGPNCLRNSGSFG
jgi:hypothetical protein